MIDGEDESEARFVVRFQSTTRSYKENREGIITENKNSGFK